MKKDVLFHHFRQGKNGRKWFARNLLICSLAFGSGLPAFSNGLEAKSPAASVLERGTAPAQDKVVIRGVVKDASGEPLVGVSVSVKNTTNGAITGVDGDYQLKLLKGDVLVFSYIGYATQEITFQGQTTLNVTLAEAATELDELVVIGYGEQKRANLTTAVSMIDQKALQGKTEPNVIQSLQGEIAGVSITPNGRPGESPKIRLRGATSLNSGGSPLVLIDGVPGNINFINPEDIESFSLLKDAASAAIYGSRAAHGVLLVTTKRGKLGKPKFNYNGYVGFLSPTEQPEAVDSYTYAKLSNEAYRNVNVQEPYTQEELNKFRDGTDPNRYPNSDWMDLLFQTAHTTRHGISAQGGTESVKYLVSGGYDYQTGPVSGAELTNYNLRSAVDVKLSERLNLSSDIRYNFRVRDEAGGNVTNFTKSVYVMNPTMIARYTDGTFGYNNWAIPNAIAAREKAGHHVNNHHDALGIMKLDYKIMEGLKFTGIANVNFKTQQGNYIGREWSLTDYFTKEVKTFGTNSVKEYRREQAYYNLQALLNYNKSFGKHSIDLMAGYQQESYRKDELSASRSNYPTDLLKVLDAGPKENWNNSGKAEHWAIASGFGRLSYNFDERYLMTASVRTDGSSRFAESKRWSSFPAATVAWRITEEEFAAPIAKYFDNIKLRASWGETGASSGLGLYPSYTILDMGSIYLGNKYSQTAYLKTVGNPDLVWERTSSLDVGVEFSTLNGNLTGTFDWYDKTTRDILVKKPAPKEFGFNDPYVNTAQIQNRGWELELAYKNESGDWTYGVSGNISNNTNKILSLGGDDKWSPSGEKRKMVGYPIETYFLYKSDGYFQTEEELNGHAKQHNETSVGDIRYVDQLTVDTDGDGIMDAGDGKINGDDRVECGDSDQHYIFGLKLNASWRNFDFTALFQGVGKHKVYMKGGGIQPLIDNGHGPIWKHQLDYWTPENRNAEYPRLLTNKYGNNNNYWRSDFWLRDAAYLRCKNVQLGYALPKNLLQKAGISHLRVYASVSNLFTITDFVDGYDPEAREYYTYPLSRTVALGINLNF